MLDGGSGDDVLTGGLGADQFLFRSTSGDDILTDFQDGTDRIRILSGAASFNGLTLTTEGENVRVSFGSVSILIETITTDDLSAADFLFG